MKIAIINGPNINLLGQREPEHYGVLSYQQLMDNINNYALSKQVEVSWFQSNHEGAIIDFIQACPDKFQALIINAAAYTHSSIAILDALLAVALPTVEVHLSDISKREDFRQVSYLRQACLSSFQGEGELSYLKALDYLLEELNETN